MNWFNSVITNYFLIIIFLLNESSKILKFSIQKTKLLIASKLLFGSNSLQD